MDDPTFKSKLADVRQLLDQCSTQVHIYLKICDLMEDLYRDMYGIKEDNKRIVATNRSLDARYGEMMSLLRDIRRTQLEL